MKNFIKYAAVGVAGYFVGFYEIKYKVIKAMLQGFIEENENDSEKKKEEA